MNTPTLRSRILCIVGPPGVGKTTIGVEVATRTGAPFHTIDTWAGVVYPPSVRSTPMTDGQVDQATSLLFSAVGQSAAVCEFAHHDYVGLLTRDQYSLFASARKVIAFADLETCNARNLARRSRVPATYIERAWHSTRDLVAVCTQQSPGRALVIDTAATPVAAAVEMAVRFFNEE